MRQFSIFAIFVIFGTCGAFSVVSRSRRLMMPALRPTMMVDGDNTPLKLGNLVSLDGREGRIVEFNTARDYAQVKWSDDRTSQPVVVRKLVKETFVPPEGNPVPKILLNLLVFSLWGFPDQLEQIKQFVSGLLQ